MTLQCPPEPLVWIQAVSSHWISKCVGSRNSEWEQWPGPVTNGPAVTSPFPCGESLPLHRKNNTGSNKKKTSIVSGNLYEPPKFPTNMSKGNWVRGHQLRRSNRFRQIGEWVHSSIIAKDESLMINPCQLLTPFGKYVSEVRDFIVSKNWGLNKIWRQWTLMFIKCQANGNLCLLYFLLL